jgi:hypothetical protein
VVRAREGIAVWGERVCAVVLAVLALAVIAPNIGSVERTASGRQVFRRDPWTLLACVVAASVIVAAIIVGQKRSRTLRIAGWVLLLAFWVLEIRL